MTKFIKTGIFTLFLLLTQIVFAQTNTATPEGEKEVDEFAPKKVETKLTEVIPTDSVGAGELVKRAEAWIKADAIKYKKNNATTSSSKVECIVAFPTKPKELNPMVDYTGKIFMKVVIECKGSKYRYTISDIRHVSKSGKCSAGSVDNIVPDCGSIGMTDIVWKKLRGEMLTKAGMIASDIKIAMSTIAAEPTTEEW